MSSNYKPKIPERVRKYNHSVSKFDQIPIIQAQKTNLPQDNILIQQLQLKLKQVENEGIKLKQQVLDQKQQQNNLECQIEQLKSTDQFGQINIQYKQKQQLHKYVKSLERQIYSIEEYMNKQGLIFVQSNDSQDTYAPILTQNINQDTLNQTLKYAQDIEQNDILNRSVKIQQVIEDKPMSTLRIKLPNNQNYIIKLSFDEDCSQIYREIAQISSLAEDSFLLFRAIGGLIPQTNLTLEQANLVPNCRLFLKYQ
ncbi:hypothetical protein SS50377_25641 [Spironucleus salmonicida]|uniref:UBX domain-containing protein n=1 Tax=Spironucleus salmonicida TaxID=348837 RepID=V6LYV7_9EUKA|nr:hypothetical protein SS50377_25641 [Spironucleus salmonicida]|eukprot:EST49458.1 hypothetical protein SS50377_10207 [Spironucleus salmonicida]